jgi:DNA-binding transcriptional ArsR family regulator
VKAVAATKIPAVVGAADAAALKTLARQAGDAAHLVCGLAVRGEMTAGEIVDVVNLSQSALSQHLARLRAGGLVAFRRTSQTLHYRIADKRALRVLQVLKEIYCGDLK